MFIAQAYNGDLDAAVDGFFDGTMESRVAAYDAGALDDDAGDGGDGGGGGGGDDDAMVMSDGDQPASGRRGRRAYDAVSDDDDDDDNEDYEDALERSDDDGIDLMSDDDDDDARVIREVEAARAARTARAREPLRPRRRAFAGYASRDASTIPAFVARDGGRGGYVGGGDGGDDAGFDLPDGIDREEARMLEAAMLGIAYVPPDHRRVDFEPSAPAPASVVAARSITNETDRAYEESLRADREKAAKSRAEQVAKEMFEAERAAAEARASAEAEAEEFARAKLAQEAAEALPDEPEATDEGVVNIAFKMPDGSRIMRRFLMSHTAKALFLFIDGYEKLHADSSRLAVVPGTYRLVAQHPRRVIENNDAGTIEGAGLTHKQEALMIDLL